MNNYLIQNEIKNDLIEYFLCSHCFKNQAECNKTESRSVYSGFEVTYTAKYFDDKTQTIMCKECYLFNQLKA